MYTILQKRNELQEIQGKRSGGDYLCLSFR